MQGVERTAHVGAGGRNGASEHGAREQRGRFRWTGIEMYPLRMGRRLGSEPQDVGAAAGTMASGVRGTRFDRGFGYGRDKEHGGGPAGPRALHCTCWYRQVSEKVSKEAETGGLASTLLPITKRKLT